MAVSTMDIRRLLSPYAAELTEEQVGQVSAYLELLLRWNAKMNLTAIREPGEIVTRHFGESFYLARHIPAGTGTVIDVGSGAGFPGIPLKIARPELTLTLIEAQQRKATFLREALRALKLEGQVLNIRAEDVVERSEVHADLVTLRAVEKFNSVLPIAGRMVHPPHERDLSGNLAVLIGGAQVDQARQIMPDWQFRHPIPIPASNNRVILIGNQASK
jgi:16S rRNA (guanine527-N7)-methyltransferase